MISILNIFFNSLTDFLRTLISKTLSTSLADKWVSMDTFKWFKGVADANCSACEVHFCMKQEMWLVWILLGGGSECYWHVLSSAVFILVGFISLIEIYAYYVSIFLAFYNYIGVFLTYTHFKHFCYWNIYREKEEGYLLHMNLGLTYIPSTKRSSSVVINSLIFVFDFYQ